MDRSPEKSALLSTKVQSLEAKTANPRQQFAHEAVTTNPIFRQLKAFSSQSTLENGSNSAGFPSPEVGIARNSEFISPLQAQYYPPTVPSAGKFSQFSSLVQLFIVPVRAKPWAINGFDDFFVKQHVGFKFTLRTSVFPRYFVLVRRGEN